MNWNTIAITAILVLFGLYEIAHGSRQSIRYSQRFLLIGGLTTGIPFLVAGIILTLGKLQDLGNWIFLVGAGWLFGLMWETWQRRKFYRDELRDH